MDTRPPLHPVEVIDGVARKRCSRCRQSKPTSEFWAKKRNKDGLSSWCSACSAAHYRSARQAKVYPAPVPFVPRACSTCGVVKDREDYWPVQGCRDGYQLQCKRCKHIWCKYKITSVEYNQMVERQSNLCLVCEGVMDPPHIDHSHETGKVRGLLCGPCNRGIGHLHDSPKLLRAAAKYLEEAE